MLCMTCLSFSNLSRSWKIFASYDRLDSFNVILADIKVLGYRNENSLRHGEGFGHQLNHLLGEFLEKKKDGQRTALIGKWKCLFLNEPLL